MDKTTSGKKLVPVVVTTEFRGVFFGYIPEEQEPDSEQMTLRNARCAVYWDDDIKGFLGLAERGPGKTSRIGPAVPSLTLFKITAVALCSKTAAEKWEANKWSV